MNANDRFEITADLFHRATGMLRPGKDQAAAMGNTPSHEERRAAFSRWLANSAYDDAVKYIFKLRADVTRLEAERDAAWAALKTALDLVTWRKRQSDAYASARAALKRGDDDVK